MPNEIEVYFPHDGLFLDANVQNWTSRWRFSCAWQHTKITETVNVSDIPTDEDTLKQMAIKCYEKHRWRSLLRNMDPDAPKV